MAGDNEGSRSANQPTHAARPDSDAPEPTAGREPTPGSDDESTGAAEARVPQPGDAAGVPVTSDDSLHGSSEARPAIESTDDMVDNEASNDAAVRTNYDSAAPDDSALPPDQQRP